MRTISHSGRVVLSVGVLVVAAVGLFMLIGQGGAPLDEAQQAGRDATSFPQAKEDYFHFMDNAVPLSDEKVQGRNMWILWTGGNDRFWDRVTRDSLASISTSASTAKSGCGTSIPSSAA